MSDRWACCLPGLALPALLGWAGRDLPVDEGAPEVPSAVCFAEKSFSEAAADCIHFCSSASVTPASPKKWLKLRLHEPWPHDSNGKS